MTTSQPVDSTPVWVEIMTTQEVVAVGLRTILEEAEGGKTITTQARSTQRPTRSRTWSSTT